MKTSIKASAVVTAIIIVAVLAIVGGGIWYYTSNKPVGCQNLWWYDNEHTTCQQPKQFCGTYMYQGLETFETKEACENSLAGETANWKTYRNEEYGFELKYPKEMQVEAKEIEEVYSSYIVNKWRDLADKVGKTTIFDFQPCGGKQLPPTTCTLKIDVLTTQILLTDFIVQDVGLDKFSLGEHGAPSYALIENSNIGGNDSQTYKIVIPGMSKYDRYYVKKDNILVIITDGLSWPSKDLGITGDQLSNQILSTFKFLK